MTKKQNDPSWHEQQAAECRRKAKPASWDDVECGLSRRIRRAWRKLAAVHEAAAEMLRKEQKPVEIEKQQQVNP